MQIHIIDSGIVESRNKGYHYVHTDVVIKVHEYIGEKKLDYEEVVVRRLGGRLGDFVHFVEMEHLNIGEEVLLFRLEQLQGMTQIPDGYSKDQYYMFQPNSKYVMDRNGIYVSENNPREKVKFEEVIHLLDLREHH